MTITFSVGLLFRALILLVTVPLAVLSYIAGWRVFLDKDLDRVEKAGGMLLWAMSLLALLATYATLVAAPMCERE